MHVFRAGLVVLENRLKIDTTAVIGQLLEAGIRTDIRTTFIWSLVINKTLHSSLIHE